ncbi:Wzz/FepE/Etk N-terminal domain-containing protein, partial [Enterococcus faecium]|uniref:Wzz/FepE/Etk N-terminal domain-containing protein n=1 Tax=Enterococcus faecium TaxID=1352 RepID=UPI00396DDBFE
RCCMQKTLLAMKPVAPRAESAEDDSIDFMEMARALWRGKFWILLCAARALAVGWYRATFFAEPRYTARTELALLVDSSPALD